jgi:siroheme synthase-like protein
LRAPAVVSAGLYPLFLRLDGRLAVVVGGGETAARKAETLFAAGARLRLVAPEVGPSVRRLLASQGTRERLEVRQRPFVPADLDGATIVIAATDALPVNREVFHLAESRGILVNVVDEPALCRFFCPSVVDRGDLKIAISTNGRSPLLAQWIRRRLEGLFPPAWERYLEWFASARHIVRERHPDHPAKRAATLHSLMSEASPELLLDGRVEEFRRRWEQWSLSFKG